MQDTIVQDAQFYYRISGAGAPVVFLHGFGEDGNIWYPFLKPLEKTYTLIVPDLPGIGSSTAGADGITLEQAAEHIKAILDKEQIARCSMIGHSMGGYITLAFAERYGDSLTHMGLFHSSAFADSEEKKLTRQKNIQFIEKHGAGKFQEQAIPNLFSEATRHSNPSITAQTINRYRDQPAATLISYTRAMMERPDRTQVLSHFPNPVLFLMGEHDTAIPIEQGLRQCHIPQLSYIYIAAHSGHMGMLEEPEFCLQAIGDFLAGK